MNSGYIFVSCILKDMKKAEKVFKELEERNIKYRFSGEFLKDDITSYKKEVYPVIEECDMLVALISWDSSKNINMHFEVSIAKENEKRIIPVLLSDFDLKK